MRTILAITAVAAVLLSGVDTPARADENNKLTYFTFSKPVQLPGKTLPAGKYRFELADPQESRRVIKGSDEDGTKQLAMLQTMPHTLRDPAKDPVVMFGDAPASEPLAAKRYRTTVLTKYGDKEERVDETGASLPDDKR
jgi:hypothetical protein